MAGLIFKAPYYKPGHRTESGKSRGGYAEYIATREGVEIIRGGMLGYIDEHPGNVWGMIISLKREDAERLGYNSAEQWINLLRSRRNDIAKEMHILPSNLRWYAAYHNKETNPHVHIISTTINTKRKEIFMANKRRPQGYRTIRKRNDGRWEARIIIGHKTMAHPCISRRAQRHRKAPSSSSISFSTSTVTLISPKNAE